MTSTNPEHIGGYRREVDYQKPGPALMIFDCHRYQRHCVDRLQCRRFHLQQLLHIGASIEPDLHHPGKLQPHGNRLEVCLSHDCQ
jgi:hypothetical protein